MNVSSKEIVYNWKKKSNKQRIWNKVRYKTDYFLKPRCTCRNKNDENFRNLVFISLKLHDGNWRYGLEVKGLTKTECWTKKKGRQEWDCKENPRNTQKNLISVVQENMNFEICVLNLMRFQTVKQKNETNCFVSGGENAHGPFGVLPEWNS